MKNNSVNESYTKCIHDVYKVYPSKSDFGIPNVNYWSTKKSGKSFHTYHESTNLFHKNKRRKSGENLKSEQYIAIFHDILKQAKIKILLEL